MLPSHIMHIGSLTCCTGARDPGQVRQQPPPQLCHIQQRQQEQQQLAELLPHLQAGWQAEAEIPVVIAHACAKSRGALTSWRFRYSNDSARAIDTRCSTSRAPSSRSLMLLHRMHIRIGQTHLDTEDILASTALLCMCRLTCHHMPKVAISTCTRRAAGTPAG
jgi:hypothetical protein